MKHSLQNHRRSDQQFRLVGLYVIRIFFSGKNKGKDLVYDECEYYGFIDRFYVCVPKFGVVETEFKCQCSDRDESEHCNHQSGG